LRTISSFVQLLATHLHGTVDSQAEEFITFAVEGAQRMQALITDLLAYTRLGGQTEAFTAVDCEAVLAHVVEALHLRIAECHAIITHDPLPTVHGDATRLGQVWQNLIGNALKFCHEPPPRIHITAQQEDHHWRFAIRDNSISLDPRQAERIFQVFQRLHPRSEYPGTRMGLAICKRIVEQHGGRMWVESAPGQGATFFFTLPTSWESA
jgi:light-regulated signal transduction histidine kinase (bacteriophytochrome)